jgi:hypothetical protein
VKEEAEAEVEKEEVEEEAEEEEAAEEDSSQTMKMEVRLSADTMINQMTKIDT